MKVLSNEATHRTLLEDGKNICSAPFDVRDNPEFAWLAIENGASINDVSYRLQNDSDFLMKYANYCAKIGIVEQDFFRAAFCATLSADLIGTYSSKFSNSLDFSLILKRKLGNKYKSPIRQLNDKNANLENVAFQYRQKEICKLRNEYYSSSYQEMHLSGSGYSPENYLRNFALLARVQNLPFSKIPQLIEEEIKRLDREIGYFRSRSKTGQGSFPERVIDALLRQSDISFEREKVFQWSRPAGKDEKKGTKRYDFYLLEKNAIIEVHGAQHYFGGFEALGGRTLEQEQSNDKQKFELAQKNGVAHYVVIDAAVSSISYIKDSVFANDCLLELLNTAHIDWDKIEAEALGKITDDENCTFAVYNFKKEFFSDLYNFFQSQIKDSDKIPPGKAFGEGCQEETKELSEWKKELKKSKNGLYPHEIIILARALKQSAPEMTYPINADNAIRKWYYEYGVSNIRPIIERLHKNGFLKIGDSIHRLSHTRKEKLMKFASKKGVFCGGKKDELIKRIVDSIPLNEISHEFPPNRYEITELGETELKENLYLFDVIEEGISSKTNTVKTAQLIPKYDIRNVIKEHIGISKSNNTETPQHPQQEQQDFSELEKDSRYQIFCVLDNSTCEKCGTMDLKIFKYSEAQVGINYPPFHDGCRCCAFPYFENTSNSRAARDRDGKSIEVQNMDWHQWRTIFGKKTLNNIECVQKLNRNNHSGKQPNNSLSLHIEQKEQKQAIPPKRDTNQKLEHSSSRHTTDTCTQQEQQDFSTLEKNSKYQIFCVLDNSTCEKCGTMDLKIFKYSEAQVGINYPPFHNGCRCYALPYFDNTSNSRAARDRDGKSIEVQNMNRHQWRTTFGKKTHSDIECAQKLKHNEHSDKRQNNSLSIKQKEQKQAIPSKREANQKLDYSSVRYATTTHPHTIIKEQVIHTASSRSKPGCFCWLFAIYFPFIFLFSKHRSLKVFARIWTIWICIVILVAQCAPTN